MQPPTKDQTDIGVDNPTIDASNDAEYKTPEGEYIDNKDMTHQEYAKDADINHMLSKFNITPERGTPTYGEWDDSIDLQTAIDSTREAQRAFNRVPKELREKFNNMDELLHAVETGGIVIKEPPAEQPVTPPAVPPA